ncbi:MAG TPA: enolase C-terminal domain-like protein [Bryobacteraceae bacterium]|nr:enolase C-terminal domain-like protein [Bryobacteraceae bacterium]
MRVEALHVSAFTVPTDCPESDGTFEWDRTTLVLAEAEAGGVRSLGYTYANAATAALIDEALRPVVVGCDVMDTPAVWSAMVRAIRNLGRPGICSMAIAAVDSALWDLKARLLDVPLAKLLGMVREGVPAYGSGGFTSYSLSQLASQLRGWVEEGMTAVKMKVGTHPEDDLQRVMAARKAIGESARLYVDANGAYSRKQALEMAKRFADAGVSWFEEPVSSDDLEGLRLIRDEAPPGMHIAAGEYGYDLAYFQRMLEAGAVDVLQADATRCAGITEFVRAGALAAARNIHFSAHTAPAMHTHACCPVPAAWNIEYFHDHARIEHMLFAGAPKPINGVLSPNPELPGMGLEFKRSDAAPYQVYATPLKGGR